LDSPIPLLLKEVDVSTKPGESQADLKTIDPKFEETMEDLVSIINDTNEFQGSKSEIWIPE